MWARSAKLMLSTLLHSAILPLPKYSVSASHLQVQYVICDKLLVFAGATCTELLNFCYYYVAQNN